MGNFENFPSTATPINAEALNAILSRLTELERRIGVVSSEAAGNLEDQASDLRSYVDSEILRVTNIVNANQQSDRSYSENLVNRAREDMITGDKAVENMAKNYYNHLDARVTALEKK